MDEARLDPKRGFVGGYQFERSRRACPASPKPIPGGWGRDRAWVVSTTTRIIAGLWIIGEDMARETNRITLHPDRKTSLASRSRMSTATITPTTLPCGNHGYKRCGRPVQVDRGEEDHSRPAVPSTHNMGTNRMSEKPRDGVVNRFGQAHDVKNLFVSDGSQFASSGGENPTLTIVALAIRQAEYIADQMNKAGYSSFSSCIPAAARIRRFRGPAIPRT